MTEQQILEDYPELQAEDFRAVYEFAPKRPIGGNDLLIAAQGLFTGLTLVTANER